MKYLLFTDPHVGLYGDKEIWHEIVLNLVNEIHDFCKKNNIENIVCLGDFFHNRKTLNTKSQHIGHRIAKILDMFNTRLIVGNHDCYYKNKIIPNSLEQFKKYKNIDVIEETKVEDGIAFVPWLGELKPAKYCMGHFEISGFHMNDSYICSTGNDVNDFKTYDRVYSGHFHTPSYNNNVVYLGSPYQQTFHDVGSKRGYYVFEYGNLEFIEFKKYPHFIKVNASQLVDNKPEDIRGNIVKLVFSESYGEVVNQKIVESIRTQNPLQLHVDFKISTDDVDGYEEEEIDVGMLDHDNLIVNYIKNREVPKHINKKLLIKMMLKFKGETIE